jgi:hypothetical protein
VEEIVKRSIMKYNTKDIDKILFIIIDNLKKKYIKFTEDEVRAWLITKIWNFEILQTKRHKSKNEIAESTLERWSNTYIREVFHDNPLSKRELNE